MLEPVPVGTLPPLGETPDKMYARLLRADRVAPVGDAEPGMGAQ